MKPLVSNIRFIVQSLPKGNHSFLDEEEKFQEKLLRLSENAFSTHTSNLSPPLRTLQEHVIQRCIVGPGHLAFLLDNGNVCRIAYSASMKSTIKLHDDANKEKGKAGTRSSKMIRKSSHSFWGNLDFLAVTGSGSWSRWASRGAVRSSGLSGATATTEASSARKTIRTSSNSNSSDSITSSGIRLIRANQVRGRNLPLFTGSQKVVVPASHVPEELINQVQNVLQGKSRSVILKELQRTHLDVNMAVNNLLSRDDEDNDDMEDGASDYIPGDELMSLLDSGMAPGDHARVVIDADAMLPEDLLGYTFSSRSVSSANRRGDNDDTDESRSQSSQWHDVKGGAGSTPGPKEPDVVLGDRLEWWDEGDGLIKFKEIGALHSELVAVDDKGGLRQWKWGNTKPTGHPKAGSLGLDKEKISFLATSLLQASVITEEGGVATFVDDLLAAHAAPMDIPHNVSDALKSERVKSLHSCALYSVVLTEQNRVYWWGIPSYNQRKKLIEKSQSSLQHALPKEKSPKHKLSVGDQVFLRSFPMYSAGAVAVNLFGGVPKIGRLLQSVWRNDTKASFKIVSSVPDAGQMGDSKGGDDGARGMEMKTVFEPTSNLRKWKSVVDNSSSEFSSRKRKRSELDDEDDGVEETWDLKDVVFVEDSHPLPPVGRIAKVDDSILAVHFGDEGPEEKGLEGILSSCRLLHRDDVMPLKTSSSKPLERIQKMPKRLTVDSRFHLHCIDPGNGGVSAVAGHDRDQLSFVKLSLSSGKVTSQRRFPTKVNSFSDQSGESGDGKFSSKAKLLSCGSGSPTLLQDYNSMLYPLLGDENGGIRDPIWADIPPLCASGMGFCLDVFNTRSVVVVLAFRSQVLMPLIMSRDVKGVRSLLNTVESNREASWAKVFYQSLLSERCDGQRNVVHMGIEMSLPSSNKEQKEDEEAQSKIAAGGEQSAPVRVSPSKPPSSTTSSSDSSNVSFLSDGDRMNAVSAIANAISSVRGFAAPSSREGAARDSLSPSKPPSFSLIPPPFLPPRIEPASYASIPRSSSEFAEGGSPVSPISMWPCDPALQWKPEDKKEEKGMNLSKRGSKDSWGDPNSSDRGSRLDALAILKLLCKSKCIQPHLKQLLKHRDSGGRTPFLFAVAHRAYPAALAIFKAAYSLAMDSPVAEESMKENYKSFTSPAPMDSFGHSELLSMLYPPGSDPDDNPMHMLCCNDTCSFTWTGALHINQDIFECLTCGLTNTLCCCTECARVCHKGHDCKLKRTSPTAYCDCWEKCACRSLVEGSIPDRTALLRVLLHTTDLYERYNSSGEHIIHFLIKTVTRQCEEQRQYRPPPRGSASSRHPDEQRHYRQPPRTARMSTTGSARYRLATRTLPPGGEQDMPEHDLRPPQFCREALLQLLSDFHAVRSLLFSGCEKRRDELSLSSKLDQEDSLHNLLPDDKHLLSSQSGTTRLDSFTHTLIVKCSCPDYLNRLLETLIHAVQVNKHREHDDGVIMARRFLRSVIRIFIVLTAQSTPDKLAAKLSLYNQSALAKCRRAFTALITLSIEELCETAEALISPVRMGVAKPTSAYPLFGNVSDIIHGSTSAFSKLPLPPRTRHFDDEDDGEGRKQNKRNQKKSRKKQKRLKSRPSGSMVGGEDPRSQETVNDEGSDHNMASQDTQPVDDEPIDGLQRLFRDISDQIEADARNEDVGLVEEESDMEITDVEVAPGSESDSDSEHDEQTPLFLGGRQSGDRESQHDEEDEDADGHIKRNEEEDTDSDAWQDEVNLERRSTREQRAQARETPHTMQWAMGVRSMVPIKGPSSSGGVQSIGSAGGGSTGGVNYVNSRSMRRNDSTLETAYLNTVLDRRHGVVRLKHSYVDDVRGASSIGATNAQLSRLFSTCIREVVQLLSSLHSGSYMNATTLGTLLEVSYQESSSLRDYVHHFLRRTWEWLLVVVQSTESQLHYGQVLSMTSDPHHPDHPHHKGAAHRPRGSSRSHGSSSSGEDNQARQDFISYILSLMRSHSGEHSDILPVVDISSMKHIAYVLDAYIYYLRALSSKPGGEEKSDIGASNSQGISLDIGYENSDNEEEEDDDQMSYQDDLYSAALQPDTVKAQFPDDCSSMSQPSSLFFHRSESMTFLGCPDANAFEVPLASAMPLAEKPHLLRPNSRKEELFGRPRGEAKDSKTRLLSLGLTTRTTALGVSASFPIKKNMDSYKSKAPMKDLPPPYSSLAPSEKGVGPSDHPHPAANATDNSKDSEVRLPAPSLHSEESNMETDATTRDQSGDAVAMDIPEKKVTVDTNQEATSMPKPRSERGIEEEISSAHSVLARCRLTLELFSRMFLDSVGAEAKSILYELGGFEVREVKFRKEMERMRTSQTVDLHLNVERKRELLIQQTFKQLNQQAKRRAGSGQPLAVLRVKVQFENEPGEGTGVARSFYTAIADALLSPLRLPNLDGVLPGNNSSSNRKSSSMHLSLVARLYKREREREERSSRGSSRTSATSGGSSERSINLRSFLTARYRELATGGQRDTIVSLSTQAPPFVKRPSRSQSGQSSLERSKQAIGDRLFPKVSAIHSAWASKITGMLLELPAYELLLLLRSERSLHDRVGEATNLLVSNGYSLDGGETESVEDRSYTDEASAESKSDKKSDEKSSKATKDDEESAVCVDADGGPPLFYQPGKRGVYAPASWGDISELRMNAYRNVGRLVGLCLLQNELCPLPLCRHVLKAMLGRKIHWHDLAFFDPVLYESLRQLVADSQSWGDDVLEAVDLTFMVDLQSEEGGGQVELTPGGASISVTKSNLMDYIRRYALYRMIGCCKKQLEKMRQGLFDVLPGSSLHYLTAEDLRLLFNGCGEVDVRALISYTMFNDESGKSGSSADKLTQLKRWFWAVVDKMSQAERQELLYFWTGSPALPASEDGFQPMPTVTIRPPDDQHLPTANTCISRLYVPLYSSRHILRQKLLLAIKTKNFGFV